jgi:hypothetical protein
MGTVPIYPSRVKSEFFNRSTVPIYSGVSPAARGMFMLIHNPPGPCDGDSGKIVFGFLPPFCRGKEGFFTVLIAICWRPRPLRTARDQASATKVAVAYGATSEGAQPPVPIRSCALATWRSPLSLFI